MRIIKQGQKPEDILHTLICHKCKCEFEFKQIEAKMNYDQRDGNFLSIRCPCCNEYLTKSV